MYLSIAHGLMRSLFAFLGAIHLLTDGALAKYVEGRLKTSDVSWHGELVRSVAMLLSYLLQFDIGLGICGTFLFHIWPRSLRI